MTLVPVAAAGVLLINVPFGYWRAAQARYSRDWFLAVHVPVPLAIGLRLLMGLPFGLASLPVFVAAFFGGQVLGGGLRRLRGRTPGSHA